MIPKNAAVAENTGKENEPPNSVRDVYQMSPFRMAMPLLNSAYPVGRVMEYIAAMPDAADRDIALAEYYFFSGQSEKCAKAVTEYQDSHDPSLRFSANLLTAFSNLAGGHTHLTRFALGNLKEQMTKGFHVDAPVKVHAIGVFTATTASVLLHLPAQQLPPLEEYLKYLPEGLRLYGFYVLAHTSEERIYDAFLTMVNKLRFGQEYILGQVITKLEYASL